MILCGTLQAVSYLGVVLGIRFLGFRVCCSFGVAKLDTPSKVQKHSHLDVEIGWP